MEATQGIPNAVHFDNGPGFRSQSLEKEPVTVIDYDPPGTPRAYAIKRITPENLRRSLRGACARSSNSGLVSLMIELNEGNQVPRFIETCDGNRRRYFEGWTDGQIDGERLLIYALPKDRGPDGKCELIPILVVISAIESLEVYFSEQPVS